MVRSPTTPRLLLLIFAVAAASPASAQPPVQPPNAPKPQRIFPPPKEPAAPPSRPGQQPPKAAEASNTTLQIDLVMTEATQALQSQTWGRVFDRLGQRVRIKTGGIEEDPRISETIRGPLRTVLVVGTIDRRGTLSFPGRTFNAGDEKSLGEWLDELKVYGAQGNPAGKPRWGLNTEQFKQVFELLAENVETDLKGQPLIDAARSLGFGIEVPLRIHDSVGAKWKSETAPLTVLQDVRGLSRGSALAVLLNDHGLCFRPVRTPAGPIELVVTDKAQTPDGWPMGWEPRPDVQRSEYAPALFEFGPVGFLERPVTETFEEARMQTGTAIVLDLPALMQKEVDLTQKTYGVPQKKTAWILVLQNALTGTNLRPHIRIDEAGRGFIVVGLFDSKSLSR